MTANSVPVAAGQQATATQYNALRSDVLDPATGHDHDGATGVAIVRPWLPGGVDGDATIAADTWLTRDMYYNSLTINVGATLYTNGWQVFVTGVCTNNGVIKSGDLQAPWCVLSASIGSGDTAFTLGTQDGTIGRFGGNAVAGASIRLSRSTARSSASATGRRSRRTATVPSRSPAPPRTSSAACTGRLPLRTRRARSSGSSSTACPGPTTPRSTTAHPPG